MGEKTSTELKKEYRIQKNIIIHIMNAAIEENNIELGRQYIEKYSSVASADSEFLECIELLKSHLQNESNSKNSTSIDLLKGIGNECNNMISDACNECVDVLNKLLPTKSKTPKSASSAKTQQLKTTENPQESDPFAELRDAYIKQKQEICDAIQKNIDDGDEQSALETICKYQLVAGGDFNDLVKQYNKLSNSKLYAKYQKALECLPEEDYAIRLRLANKMVMLMPDDENEKILEDEYSECIRAGHSPLPDKSGINDIKSAMSALQSEKDFAQRTDYCLTILKGTAGYLAEYLRCRQISKKISENLAELDTVPEDDYKQRVDIYGRLNELDPDSEVYQTELQRCKVEFEKQLKLQLKQIEAEYADNKTVISNQIVQQLQTRHYSEAASMLERYYPVAQTDSDFVPTWTYALNVAKDERQKQLRCKLENAPKDDYETRVQVYKELSEDNPFDQDNLNKLYKCEEALERQQLSQSTSDDDNVDSLPEPAANNNPVILNALPTAVSFCANALMKIQDSGTIDRVADMLMSAAQMSQKASGIASTVGNFMHAYSNCPLIQLVPHGQSVSPVMEMISKSAILASRVFQANGNVMSIASSTIRSTGSIMGGLVTVIKSGKALTDSFKGMASEACTPEGIEHLKQSITSVVSVVVGNYNMTQIGTELDHIQSALNKIMDFQDSEYKSKVAALFAQVTRMSTFSAEILANEELCKRELIKMNNIEHECIELVGQSNISLKKLVATQQKEYEKYETTIQEIEKWFEYQRSLMQILHEMSKLSFTFNRGEVSLEHCNTLYRLYEKQSNDVNEMIRAYHREAVERFEIDLEAGRRKRGGIGGLFSKPRLVFGSKALFGEDNKYQPIEQDILDMIATQMLKPTKLLVDDRNPYKDDIMLVFKDDGLYYYSESDASSQIYNLDWVVNTLKAAEESGVE